MNMSIYEGKLNKTYVFFNILKIDFFLELSKYKYFTRKYKIDLN